MNEPKKTPLEREVIENDREIGGWRTADSVGTSSAGS
jgi:hypothetical protein